MERGCIKEDRHPLRVAKIHGDLRAKQVVDERYNKSRTMDWRAKH